MENTDKMTNKMTDKIAGSPQLAPLAAYVDQFLLETNKITNQIDRTEVVQLISQLKELRTREGRLFILGVGGSAANASHAVNDFRKIANIEAYTPFDNVSELTARINDDSWETSLVEWLKGSRLKKDDALLVLSVGGGSATTSLNLVRAMEHAKQVGSKVFSIVSRNGGCARELSDVCVLIPVVSESRITPHAEGWQAVVWHMVVTGMHA